MRFDHPLASTCLFLDVDGSLIDIAARPDDVTVPATLVANLARASRRLGGALALVSGRRIVDLDRLFTPARLPASGVHGAEMRYEGDGETVVAPDDAIDRAVWDDLAIILERYPGAFAEDKIFSFAVHFRAVPQVAAALTSDLRSLVDHQRDTDLRLMPGHFVMEVKRSSFDKGKAVGRFLTRAPFAGRRPIFVGDDVTDLPGFAAAHAAGGEAYSVGAALQGATATFANPSDVRDWVAQIAESETLHA